MKRSLDLLDRIVLRIVFDAETKRGNQFKHLCIAAQYLAFHAFQAPIPEEFAKSLGPGLMVKRIQNERSAFFLGLTSGAGFAILENMLYEGLYASWSGWSWGGITALRAIGSVMHPLCTGIVVLALYRERERNPGWFGRLGRAYLIAVGLHTLWNGGFEALFYISSPITQHSHLNLRTTYIAHINRSQW